MPTNFPTSVDNFTNPTANDSLNLPSHSTQHANANDAIEAIEGYLFGRLRIKQIVTGATSTAAFNSTSTYADSGLTATITPSSATSKIMVLYMHGNMYKNNVNSQSQIQFQVLRNATTIGLAFALYTNTAMDLYLPGFSGMIYDEPATTSAVTYKTQFANVANVAAVGMNISFSTSRIILIEVEA